MLCPYLFEGISMGAAREKKESKAAKAEKEARPYLGEVRGILFLALALFIGLALFSYSPTDPSLNSIGAHPSIHNLGGLIGAYTADGLISLLGLASYLVVLVLLVLGISSFRESGQPFKYSQVLLLLFFLAMASVLFQLKWRMVEIGGVNQEVWAGGLFGSLIAEPLRQYLNSVGAYLAVISLGLLTFVWGTGVSIAKMAVYVKRFLVACALKGKSLAVIYAARLKKAFEKYQESRRQALKVKEAAEKEAKVPQPVKISIPRTVEPSPPLPEKVVKLLPKEKPPEPEKIERKVAEAPALTGGAEPKVFQRVDVKENAKKVEDQLSFSQMMKGFVLPPLNILDAEERGEVKVDEESLKMNSKLLEKKLLDFGVEGRVTEIHPGPVITMYEFEPAAGIKVSKIVNLEDDLTLAMGGRSVRIVSHLQGKPAVGIEIPNHTRETVYLKEILSDLKFQKAESKLTLCLGKDTEGLSYVSDLQKMPHLLVAGATGAGKSVCLNAIILSMLYKATPEEVRFIFVDPKMLELSIYQGIPHLLLPVVTEPKKAAISLRWAVAEMERRYKLMSDAQVRNLAGYNKKIEKGELKDREIPVPEGSQMLPLKHEDKLPFIVIIIDELADLMMVAGREVEEYITRLAQMARAAGIHLILATQRPSVDVITGIIKANFPARVSFKVSSAHDSRTIIDTVGAEHLLGMGDMLFIPPGIAKLVRVHGAFVSDSEVTRVVEHLKKQGKPVYDESILNFKEPKAEGEMGDEESDELYDQAVAIVTETRQASISMVQRRLRIGYNRAARMIERMEQEGIVSAPDGAKGREVLASNFAEGSS
ncbi:MAG: DNA translocase FtsK 4TM domain-containing protein [bacterium]